MILNIIEHGKGFSRQTSQASVRSPLILATGSLAAFFLILLVLPATRGWFSTPDGGIGAVTIARYPKSHDYFTIIVLFAASFLGGWGAIVLARRTAEMSLQSPSDATVLAQRSGWRMRTCAAFVLLFAMYFLAHEHPYHEMDFFHEGEHLSPASELRAGKKPYSEVFFLHGLAIDGGLDALFLGESPSPLAIRRIEAFLNAATIALLAPIAAELVVTPLGFGLALLFGVCALGAGQVAVFPYFRLAPLLLTFWFALRYARRDRSSDLLICALVALTGLLWSLEVGLYSVAGLCGWLIVRRILGVATMSARRAAMVGSAAMVPFMILILAGADVRRFVRDSFLIIPSSIDAVWSLPAPPLPELSSLPTLNWIDSESARYYLPPVFYGALLALAFRHRRQGRLRSADCLALVAIFSLIAFRTAAGRAGWSHTRFGVPFLGVALAAYLVEPFLVALWRREKRVFSAVLLIVVAVPLFLFLEVPENAAAWSGFVKTRQSRLRPGPGMVTIPLARASELYTYPQNARDLTALSAFDQQFPPHLPILVFSGEKALYYLLDRRSATRVQDMPMLSVPSLQSEALAQMRANPPAYVVMKGLPALDNFDGVTNSVRAPEIAGWILANYPLEVTVGRFVIATR